MATSTKFIAGSFTTGTSVRTSVRVFAGSEASLVFFFEVAGFYIGYVLNKSPPLESIPATTIVVPLGGPSSSKVPTSVSTLS